MGHLRIYLDTSVISHLFHDDAPERLSDTLELFENTIRSEVHEANVSRVVVDELSRTRDPELRERLLAVLDDYPIRLLPDGGDAVVRLASAYLNRGIIPERNPEDALRVAYATAFRLDVLVTWNYRHLARATTEQKVAEANRSLGHDLPLRLLTPLEVLTP